MCSLTDTNKPYYCSHMATQDDYTAFIDGLDTAIKLSGKSRKQIAKESGIHPTTLQRILNKKRAATVPTMFQIAKATNVEATKIINRSLCKECIKNGK